MKEKEKQRIKDLYRERLNQYGATHEALGWPRNDQHIRFSNLVKYWNYKNKTIVDYGCGFGDFYQYLESTGIMCDYLGLDLSHEMIDIAQKSHPDVNFKTISEPLADLPKCDIITACGTHALYLEDNLNFIKESFQKFAVTAKEGFVVTFLSSFSTKKNKKNYYANPMVILEYAYTISKRIIMDNSFMPYEFAIFVDLREKTKNLAYK